MKKNGFISTTLIYAFFIVFLLLMLFLLNSYSRVRYLLGEIKYDIKNNFSEITMADINLNIFLWNSQSGDFELAREVPSSGYLFEPEYSYCRNGGNEEGASVTYENGDIVVSSKGRDFCYAYFSEAARDVNLRIYTKESDNSPEVYVNKMPGINYTLTSATCDEGTIKLNAAGKFEITSKKITNCKAVYTKKETDVGLRLYRESATGGYTFNGKNYVEVKEIPGSNYTYNSNSSCTNGATLQYANEKFTIKSNKPTECNAYFDGDGDNVELIIMIDTTPSGEAGFTTGKKYSRTYNVPTSGYRFVGAKCDDSKAVVTYKDGKLETSSENQTTCRAYFDLDKNNVLVRYHLEKSNGGYESVTTVPRFGYNYNSSMSKCEKGGKITIGNDNTAIVEASPNDVCDIYYDLVNADVVVEVYVMNRTTQSWELGNVPNVGYVMSSSECTNNASVEYVNGKLNIYSENPTVCKVYFR